jgi:hypothetical protein
MEIIVRNQNGQSKKIKKVGFSWTTLFFGFFPALFRGDFKWAIIIFSVNCFSCGLARLIFMFTYNELYINDLLKDGYRPVKKKDVNYLRSHGIRI